MWNKYGLNIQLDITTYCNAKCPQCHRTNPEGLDKVDWLPLLHWTLEDFQKAFSEEDILTINAFTMCPTWGDPVMNPHLYDIVEYIFSVNKDIKVNIDTNGSIRDENWWWEFGLLSKGNKRYLQCVFDIDGINQEMHEQYRRNTSLQKILNNMQSFADTLSVARSSTIVFKHNQDYLEDIKKLAHDYGSQIHTFIKTNRYNFDFIDENNKPFSLEMSDLDFSHGKIAKINKSALGDSVECTWSPANHITINFDGQVHPCCYFGNPHGMGNNGGYMSRNYFNHSVIQTYNADKLQYNVFHNSIHDIMGTNWFKSDLPNSWKSDNPVPQCFRHCCGKSKKSNQPRITVITTDG